MQFLFGFLLSVISLFLILIILVQRGRGGGLTGALGGMGGQSAFGTKAGDTFTRITVGVATVWILMAILSVKLLGGKAGGPLGDPDAVVPVAPAATSEGDGGAGILEDLPATGSTNASPETSEGTSGGDAPASGDGGTTAESEPGDQ